MVYPPRTMGQRKGMYGYDVPSSSQHLFRTSLDIAGALDMSMERPPPVVSIHLQTPTKVDVYPVPQGQQEQLEEQHQLQPPSAPAATPGREDSCFLQVAKRRISVRSVRGGSGGVGGSSERLSLTHSK
ncbi:hypothetical protein E2C01_087984 [Portunus trituberculatus]|uniref:Uncharacterized protein n=1 Tax=Portunus trituberculatus TaxID=210409 RepID=A0A5B7J9J7_PORTR|nr:hypothetical protein [Portunus trituberculatus]